MWLPDHRLLGCLLVPVCSYINTDHDFPCPSDVDSLMMLVINVLRQGMVPFLLMFVLCDKTGILTKVSLRKIKWP